MKNIIAGILVILGLTFTNCNNEANRNDRDENYDQSQQPAVTNDATNDFETERTEYGNRVRTRLDEMEIEIREARERRKAEKNADRIKEYDVDIERRERDRKTLQERWQAAESKTEAEWQEFKKEVEEFFDEDRRR